MSTTVLEAAEEARGHLYGMHRGVFNTLKGSLTASATSVPLNLDTTGVTNGTYLSADLELMLVVSVDHTANTATVVRGQLGSKAASHSDGALVEVNPRFSLFHIVRQMRREIRSWPTNLFATSEVTIPSGDVGVVDTGLTEVYYPLRARLDDSGSDDLQPRRDVRLVRGGAASGVGVRLAKPYETAPVTVTLAVPFDVSKFDLTTDLEATVGIPPEALDIPPLGVAWRLSSPREIKRTFTEQQGDARVRDEVPPGHILQTGAAMKRARDLRIGEEQTRLRAIWPYASGGV